jgi:hypothetical protein
MEERKFATDRLEAGQPLGIPSENVGQELESNFAIQEVS